MHLHVVSSLLPLLPRPLSPGSLKRWMSLFLALHLFYLDIAPFCHARASYFFFFPSIVRGRVSLYHDIGRALQD
ncbi:hypothetical protein BC940DRAFT_289588 [Gongronella butleri]|nr:hypothetical protein BC940DRAFT_289588 [Gongronella butleri]